MTGTASHAAGAGMPWPWVSSRQGSQTPPSPGTTTVNTTLRTTRLSDWVSGRPGRVADRRHAAGRRAGERADGAGDSGQLRPHRAMRAGRRGVSAEHVALALALVRALVEQATAVVPEGGGVARVVPHVPGLAPVAVGLGVRALAGVDLHVAVRLDLVRAERIHVMLRVAQRPAGHGDPGTRGVVELYPLVVQARVAARVRSGRVIPDFADLHPGGRLRRRRDGKDHAEQDHSENQQPAHSLPPTIGVFAPARSVSG